MKEFKTEIKQLKRIYYDENTGYLCDRYPKNIKHKEDGPFIEVDDDQYEQTFSVSRGKVWSVVDGKLEIVDDVEEQNSPEYKRNEIQKQITRLKAKLASTDYQSLKYSEGAMTEEEFEPIKKQREEWRKQINLLEEKIRNI